MRHKIFISYRREDSAANALGISQYLEHEFGRKNVFIDVDMRAGTKFPVVLEQRLAECKVMIALIGPDWLNSRDEEGQRRLDNSDDWVRLEIAHALKKGVTVIPLRVNGTALPVKATLPADIQGLLDHQAVSVSTSSFRSDMAGLTKDIRLIPSPWPWRRFGAVATGLLLPLLVGLVLAYNFGLTSPEGIRRLAFSNKSKTEISNGLWSSRPGEWVMFAIDLVPVAYFYKPSSVKAFDNKIVYTGRVPFDPNNPAAQPEYVYAEDIAVLDCNKPIWAFAERTYYNKSGEVVFHYKWGDPETLDLSIGPGPINSGSVVSTAQHLLCDAQLRKPLLAPSEIANMKLSHLSSTPNGDGEVFYGPMMDISNPIYQKEMLFVVKHHRDHMLRDLDPKQNVRGLSGSYRTLANLLQFDCTSRKLRAPKIDYFDQENILVYTNAPMNDPPIVPAKGTPFDKVMNMACGPSVAGTYEGMNSATYEKGRQAEQKISITIEQVSSDLNVVFQTVNGAQGKGSGKLTGTRVESMSLESTAPGCPGSYKGSMEFPGDTVTWSYKGEDCGGPMEGHGTAKRTKS
jgi:TIR domain